MSTGMFGSDFPRLISSDEGAERRRSPGREGVGHPLKIDRMIIGMPY